MKRVFIVWLAVMAALSLGVKNAMAGPAILIDGGSGTVLYAEDQDHPWYPASTTKLMTAYLVFEDLRRGRIKLSDAVLQSERSIKEPPSKIGLPVGLGMSIELALQSLIIKSANDVAVMLAEKLAGSVENFARRMNRKAKELGMTSTHFANPNGLPNPNHFTTARDLAILAMAIWRDFPEHRDRFSHYYMKIGKRRLHSYNSLLRTFEGADGMKTGFICASGYNIVASATRNGRRLIAVVLGAKSPAQRARRTSDLLSYGFEYYDWKMKLAGNDPDMQIRTMPIGPDHNAEPVNMRSIVCRPHRARRIARISRNKRHRSRRRARARK